MVRKSDWVEFFSVSSFMLATNGLRLCEGGGIFAQKFNRRTALEPTASAVRHKTVNRSTEPAITPNQRFNEVKSLL